MAKLNEITCVFLLIDFGFTSFIALNYIPILTKI